MGGDSNPWCLAAHTLSRRAQSTALSPIHLSSRAKVEGSRDVNFKVAPRDPSALLGMTDYNCNLRNNSSSGN
jgi:hypothetical protein